MPANSSIGKRVSQIMGNVNWSKLDNKFVIFKRKQHKQSKYFNFLNISNGWGENSKATQPGREGKRVSCFEVLCIAAH